MSEMIITILCIGLLSIYALLGVTFLIHSIADIFDNRRRAKREEEREKRDLEYHEMRMKEFSNQPPWAVGAILPPFTAMRGDNS